MPFAYKSWLSDRRPDFELDLAWKRTFHWVRGWTEQNGTIVLGRKKVQCHSLLCPLSSLCLPGEHGWRSYESTRLPPIFSGKVPFPDQFDLDYCQAFYHEPLAREIAEAIPVLLTLDKLFQSLFCRFLFPTIKGVCSQNSIWVDETWGWGLNFS